MNIDLVHVDIYQLHQKVSHNDAVAADLADGEVQQLSVSIWLRPPQQELSPQARPSS